MLFQVRCGSRMDGSGAGPVFSSPNCKAAPVIEGARSERGSGDDRLPLPPGHPLSWMLLTMGTVLEGSTYTDSL